MQELNPVVPWFLESGYLSILEIRIFKIWILSVVYLKQAVQTLNHTQNTDIECPVIKSY